MAARVSFACLSPNAVPPANARVLMAAAALSVRVLPTAQSARVKEAAKVNCANLDLTEGIGGCQGALCKPSPDCCSGGCNCGANCASKVSTSCRCSNQPGCCATGSCSSGNLCCRTTCKSPANAICR